MTDAGSSSAGASLVAILDELSDLLASARSMPMSASAIVNRAEVMELIDSAKDVLPTQISRADGVMADADAVLERARSEAADIVERGHSRAEELISEQHVVTQARSRAKQIVADAEATAEKLARDADDYCDRQLAKFEIDLNAIAGQVSAGRARLEERTRGRSERTGEHGGEASGRRSRARDNSGRGEPREGEGA